MNFTCRYCEKEFRREQSLAVHLCEHKRRYQEEKEIGVQLGLQAYLRFYEITQGSARLKTFDDFVRSPYYRAFVKFGRQCVAVRAINPERFVEWLLKHNKKIDHWTRDSVYAEYLYQYLRAENVNDALARAIEFGESWSVKFAHPGHDCLRYGNPNSLIYEISAGRISAWIIYNCDSGLEFLAKLNHEQVALIWPFVDSDFWERKFCDYPADTEYARKILESAGW